MKIVNLKTTLLIVSAVAGLALLLNGCSRGAESGIKASDKPYVDLQELNTRGVPAEGFSKTSFKLGSDNTIELRYNTFGRPKDQESIGPAMERVKFLMQDLMKKHPVHMVVIDGDSSTPPDGKSRGTGKAIWDVTFPVVQ